MYSEIYAELGCMYLGQVLAGLGYVWCQSEGVWEITQSHTASAPKFPCMLRSHVLALAGSVTDQEFKIRLACQGNVCGLPVRQSPGCLYNMGIRPIERTPINRYTKKPIYFLRTVFYFVFLLPSSGSSRVWRSLPFCAEKRPYFLSEIEEFFVALLVKQSFSSSRKYDGYRGIAQFCVATLRFRCYFGSLHCIFSF